MPNWQQNIRFGDPGRTQRLETYQPLRLANGAKNAIDNTHKITPLANTTAKENAANLAGFNGVKLAYEVSQLPELYITAFPILAMHWGALV